MTKIKKDIRDGWCAEDTIDLGVNTDDGAMQIHISTSKRYSGELASIASVRYAKGDGSFSFMVFQDYNKGIIRSKTRVTEKAVALQHAQALEKLPAIKAEVATFYKIAL